MVSAHIIYSGRYTVVRQILSYDLLRILMRLEVYLLLLYIRDHLLLSNIEKNNLHINPLSLMND